MGVDDAAIAQGLLRLEPPPGRLHWRRLAHVSILDDSYNANPDSMRAALETFAELADASPRRIAILGDMLELGGSARCEFEALAQDLADRPEIDGVIAIGGRLADQGLARRRARAGRAASGARPGRRLMTALSIEGASSR